MSDPLVSLDGVRFSHPGQRVPLSIPALSIGAGERVAVIGPSGSGKTTLLHLIAGILAPSAGRITVAGVDLTRASAPKRRRFRLEQIGLVFQEFELLEHLNVLDNILLTCRIASSVSLDRRHRDRQSVGVVGACLAQQCTEKAGPFRFTARLEALPELVQGQVAAPEEVGPASTVDQLLGWRGA